jgi:Tol biopolymer transport system component
MRCLEKDPQRRYQNAADLRVALADLREDLTAPEGQATPTAGATTAATVANRVLRPLGYAAAALAIAATGFIAMGVLRSSEPVTPSYRPFITEVTSATNPVWSPDGKTLAYVDVINGERQIFVRGIDASQSARLTTEPAGTTRPFWAPDGSRIYYVRASDRHLVSVGAGGGKPQLVAAVVEAASANLSTIPHPVKACISPDGRTIVFTIGDIGRVRLWTLDTKTGVTRTLDTPGMPQMLGAVGTLAFSPDGTTLAALASTTGPNLPRGVWLIAWPSGVARHILSDAPYRTGVNSGLSWMPDSRRVLINGSHVRGGPDGLLMVDTLSGTLGALTAAKDTETSASVSPDGRRIAFVSERSGMDLVQFPVDGGPPEPLVASSRTESYPDVSASGLLAYVTDAEGYAAVRLRSLSDTWSRPLGGASEFERAEPPGEVRLSPDGRRAAVATYGAEHLIWIFPVAGGTPVRLDSESTEQHGPSWSPDGNWIAYRRLLNGAFSIVKAPLGGGAIVRLDEASTGSAPTDWSPTGEWIAHSRPDGMHLVSPDGSTPTRVLAGLHAYWFRFSHDGSRLFAVRRGENRRWELVIWDVAAGRELRVVALPLASASDVQWLAVSPDNARIILSAGTNTSDIWLLEQFERSPSQWARWVGW